MTVGPIEVYHPRAVSDHGVWEIGSLHVKVYDLLAPGKEVTDDMVSVAKQFLEQDVRERVAAMGESNGLGFVIIHPGEVGLTVSAHWWAQGSVLCQHIYRQEYAAVEPMDTVARPVVACVWELALINAEQEAWRETMMTREPDRAAYLASRSSLRTA